MKADFWHDRWKTRNIRFHKPEANPTLIEHFDTLELVDNARIFLPLCGKTLDIAWLLSSGYQVVGAELSEIAIIELFDELGITPKITDIDSFKLYSAENIDIFVGDIFDLTPPMLGHVDAVYDRAALVALPADVRSSYAKHLTQITNNAQQLLLTLEYDQSVRNGPPFSVPQTKVETHYRSIFIVNVLADDGEDYDMKELVFHLIPRR
ncbi:thiopurine S-methyltransferase [Lentilitoribacter sp. Alg239-R112]|uniref:thiopurine S-methyltransferase n=1 Tax=Lentilitoribacter sp. Alg239-R112 TaxID=2305987 RepID=UPI0013A6C394|nr:thiopurine S-methyltransferase [Lentilitoribacter sp. Alg239-R112]